MGCRRGCGQLLAEGKLSVPPIRDTRRLSFLTMSLQKLRSWYTRKSPVELWLDLLRTAEAFEDWEEAALHLDNLLGLDLWQVCPQNVMSRHLDAVR